MYLSKMLKFELIIIFIVKLIFLLVIWILFFSHSRNNVKNIDVNLILNGNQNANYNE